MMNSYLRQAGAEKPFRPCSGQAPSPRQRGFAPLHSPYSALPDVLADFWCKAGSDTPGRRKKLGVGGTPPSAVVKSGSRTPGRGTSPLCTPRSAFPDVLTDFWCKAGSDLEGGRNWVSEGHPFDDAQRRPRAPGKGASPLCTPRIVRSQTFWQTFGAKPALTHLEGGRNWVSEGHPFDSECSGQASRRPAEGFARPPAHPFLYQPLLRLVLHD